MAKLEVCVIGEINPDLILYGLPQELEPEREFLIDGFSLTLGSSSAIFAHNLAVLGTRVGMISKIGNDPLGKVVLERVAAGGVDVTHVKVSDHTPTGVSVILTQARQRVILTYPGTMFELSYDDLDFDYILSARHLHISSFFLHRKLRPRIADLFQMAKAEGLSTSMDTNDDPEDKWDENGDVSRVLDFVDTLFVNEREVRKLAQTEDLEDATATLAGRTKRVVVKLGAKGAVVREGSREWRHPALAVDVIDAVGAGDSFDAGYIHSLLRGDSPENCLAFANAAGALSTTKAGGTEAFRDRVYVSKFFQEHLRAV
ncbi:MAG TPA: carbohydrate kinase family protein [Terriglobales bacterium]|nr:carbohydrate kinase family protein [Terriglobales bacterium]